MPWPEAMLLSWSRLPLRALTGSLVLLQPGTVFMACAAARNHGEAHDPASTDCKEQGSYFCNDIDDFRHTVEEEGQGGLL